MRLFRKNGGFTLVELLVTISIGAIVTLAATTVLLMGFRINRQSVDTVTRQNTTRVLLTAMEDIATEGVISGIEMGYDEWAVYGEEVTPGTGVFQTLFSYDAEKEAIFTGKASDGTVIMKNVLSSYLEYNNGLLTISVETKDGIYESSVYCRTAVDPSGSSGSNEVEDVPSDDKEQEALDKEINSTIPGAVARKAFLELLASQYKITSNSEFPLPKPITNSGLILNDGKATGHYYTEWYITDNFTKNENWNENGWNENTPWCACFISWAVYESMDYLNYNEPDNDTSNNFQRNERPSYADVDSFISYFYLKNKADKVSWITSDFWTTDATDAMENLDTVYPGDIIFFDWIINEEQNPQHVGVVLYVDETNGLVYTIEGNTSNMVGVRQYKIDDPRILGYGVLDWKTVEVTQ